ncbi:CD3324 family protein [Bacillus carboniphilus]|uniref:CD3324 family protein n=1 Tax=Bacillus carboniphilus TaxID=86663 RepID=A0ABP3GBW6_9BACI
MKYVNATAILPASVLKEVQKYVQGETLYIPKPESTYEKWGTKSGGRKAIDERNRSIKKAFQSGVSIDQLASKHFLSRETIKKIVYTK